MVSLKFFIRTKK